MNSMGARSVFLVGSDLLRGTTGLLAGDPDIERFDFRVEVPQRLSMPRHFRKEDEAGQRL